MTAYEFMRTKMEMFECSDQTLGELEKYEEEIIDYYGVSNLWIYLELSHVLWDYHFLCQYSGLSDDEDLLITTIKNKMRGDKDETYQPGKPKKTRRIRWQDQMRPSSPFSISSVKNIPKSAIMKGRMPSPSPSSNYSQPHQHVQF